MSLDLRSSQVEECRSLQSTLVEAVEAFVLDTIGGGKFGGGGLGGRLERC